jgi:hypothetical protein
MISAAMSIQAKTGRRMERSASDAMAEPRRFDEGAMGGRGSMI